MYAFLGLLAELCRTGLRHMQGDDMENQQLVHE